MPWTVVDAGAGPGTLLAAVLAAGPRCAEALRPIGVDRAEAQRARHPAGVEPRAELPDRSITGVVLANELLDNVPWRLVERAAGGWVEVLVGVGSRGSLVEVTVPLDAPTTDRVDGLAPDAETGARLPLEDGAAAWLREALGLVERGRVVVLDYASTTSALAARPQADWCRTYRGHERGADPLLEPGTQDITVEVAADQLAAVRPPDEDRPQADFLRAHDLEGLVAEGRRVWAERAHLGDLEALRARSRVGEADALTDPAGLGAFRVLEWAI